MTPSLWVGVIWVILSAMVAMLEMRWQRRFGLPLFFAAPFLVIWLSIDFGWFIGVACFVAFVSMYRHPLRYFVSRLFGRMKK